MLDNFVHIVTQCYSRNRSGVVYCCYRPCRYYLVNTIVQNQSTNIIGCLLSCKIHWILSWSYEHENLFVPFLYRRVSRGVFSVRSRRRWNNHYRWAGDSDGEPGIELYPGRTGWNDQRSRRGWWVAEAGLDIKWRKLWCLAQWGWNAAKPS